MATRTAAAMAAKKEVLKVYPKAFVIPGSTAGFSVLRGPGDIELGCGWSRERAWVNAAREVELYHRAKETSGSAEKLRARLPLQFEWVGPLTDAKFGLVLATEWMRDTLQHVHVRREGRGLFRTELLTWTYKARKKVSMVEHIELSAPTLRAVQRHAENVVRLMAEGKL